jgi:hypothetical protein
MREMEGGATRILMQDVTDALAFVDLVAGRESSIATASATAS